MLFHVNYLLADHSHEIIFLFIAEKGFEIFYMSSAANFRWLFWA